MIGIQRLTLMAMLPNRMSNVAENASQKRQSKRRAQTLSTEAKNAADKAPLDQRSLTGQERSFTESHSSTRNARSSSARDQPRRDGAHFGANGASSALLGKNQDRSSARAACRTSGEEKRKTARSSR